MRCCVRIGDLLDKAEGGEQSENRNVSDPTGTSDVGSGSMPPPKKPRLDTFVPKSNDDDNATDEDPHSAPDAP